MNSYELSRNYFDWCFENPEKISVNHTAIYFFAIEHCNRLGWKAKFGFPTQMVMDALGIKKHQTYIRYFNELVEFGFIELIQKSQNQYSANIISLNNDMLKNGKALDKAIINHTAKQIETTGQSNGQSNSSIDKQINKEPLTIKPQTKEILIIPENLKSIWDLWIEYRKAKKIKNYAGGKFEQMAIDKLIKFSDSNPITAKQIIENSITNSYTGFFEIKNLNNNQNGKTEFRPNRNR
jgi:hypothetical protein